MTIEDDIHASLETNAHDREVRIVALHLIAHARGGKGSSLVGVVGVAAAIASGLFWLLVPALVLCVAAYLFVIQCCVRQVARATGIRPAAQALLFDRYKKNHVFANEVNKFVRESHRPANDGR